MMELDLTGHLRRHAPPVLIRAMRITVWGVLHVLLSFAEQVAELAAPLLLVCGLGWWALPQVLGLVEVQGEARQMLDEVIARFPHGLQAGGFWLTPGRLIADGLLLMVLAALLQTVSAILTQEIYER